ncbi:MAG: M1 family metallopeptidase [Ferruginibacter sp.]
MAKPIALKIFLLLFLVIINSRSFAQANYWQQQADYKIEVSLHDEDHSLDGDLQATYANNSPDTLHFLWVHLWPNAYKNDKTAFSDQLLENGNTAFYFADEEKRGYINRLNFIVDEKPATISDHPLHQDIVKLLLPEPLAPGETAHIKTPFHVKLPYLFSRSGYLNKSYQVTQWFPKIAVYDRTGWHEMPYLDQGEFYSDFGNYRVGITVPSGFVVAATGSLKEKITGNNTTQYEYEQNNVHDFAWFADKDYLVKEDTLLIENRVIKLAAYYREKNAAAWSQSIDYIKSAVRTKSEWLGAYPWNTVTVVESAADGMGAMEYPTITVISPTKNNQELDYLINHEIGHNWFYGILASNERDNPWMDEGMNAYYDRKYMMAKYGVEVPQWLNTKSKFLNSRMPGDAEKLALEILTVMKGSQPISTPAADFNNLNYNVVAYTKTALWLQEMERVMGQEKFAAFMKAYYDTWKFRHPSPHDFLALARPYLGDKADSLFRLIETTTPIQKTYKKNIQLRSFFSFWDTDKHHYIFVAPAIGYNAYDKIMAGMLVHNYTLPPVPVQFVGSVLYGTGSKSINGIGQVSWQKFIKQKSSVEIGVSGASFNMDSYQPTGQEKHFLRYTKAVPFLRYFFPVKNPRSRISTFFQWKTYLIRETGLSFSYDSVQQVYLAAYPEQKRVLNQLSFETQNARVLYPWKANITAEQGQSFVRLGFTGNYFFNYPKSGGLAVRLFAGKFIYTGDKSFTTRFETNRYHLNLTGAKGYEDYTYSNYFVGRNEFEGLGSQQIMIRDGAFKVRTDLLSSKIGKSDDWLFALNFTTSIPSAINPFSLTPLKIPLKAFADIGSYAEAWEKNASTGKFLLDAGLQLSLFDNTINIYVPLVYSKVYSDYFKSTITKKRFVRNISFSIDVEQLSMKKLLTRAGL